MKPKKDDDLSDWDATLGDGLDDDYKEYEVYGDKKRRGDMLAEMMKNDQELGLYDEPITLSEKDAEVFFNEIENPSEPNEKLVNAATQYNEDIKKNEIDSATTNVEEDEVTLTDEEKAALEPEITDEILMNLQPDYSPRGIDLDNDGSIDGIDTNADGMIDKITAHPNRAQVMRGLLPYYARADFNWDDRKNWINDQNAVNYWITNIKQSQYPSDFESKTY
jgi:hypothetical protein